jgi:hypothetical protein
MAHRGREQEDIYRRCNCLNRQIPRLGYRLLLLIP